MPRTVVLDELHLTVRVPADLPDAEAEAARQILLGPDFTARLREAIRAFVREFPELAACRVSVAR